MNNKVSRHSLPTRVAKGLFRYTPIPRLIQMIYAGEGVIFMLHRVLPPGDVPRITANARLEIYPEFLESVIDFVTEAGYEIVSLDQLHERLDHGPAPERFACFTFDDGYADNYDYVYPIFRRRGLPFAVYVTTAYVDKKMVLWHYMLETLILSRDKIRYVLDGREHTECTANHQEKEALYHRLCDMIMGLPREAYPGLFNSLFQEHGIRAEQFHSHTMDWDQVVELSRDPLVTIGAHTVNHYNLATLDEQEALWEIMESKSRLEQRIGKPVEHFAYPYGKPFSAGPREFRLAEECGFKTMTTTREGNIFQEHRQHLSCLPRIEITGRYQDLTVLDMRLAGLLSIVRNGLGRVVTV